MKQTKTMLIALLLLAGVTSLGSMTGWAQPRPASAPRPVGAEESSDEGIVSKSFTVSKGGTLDLSTSQGEITISTWSKDEVLVEVYGLADEEKKDLRMTQSGNTVRVEYRRRYGGWGSQPDMKYEISVPEQFDLALKTAGGDIEVRGKIVGTIRGNTSGGNMRVDEAVGEVDFTTSGGDISGRTIKGNVDFRTSGGNIELGTVSGEASIKTSGGNIRIQSIGKALRAGTSGGDIEIGEVQGEATVSTSGGDVRVEKLHSRSSLHTSGGDITLNGADGPVIAKTSGGDVSLRNIAASIEAKTSGGAIRADLRPTGNGRSSLESSGGDIRITIPEGAKANIEATIRFTEPYAHKRYSIRSDFKAEREDNNDHEFRSEYILNGGGEYILLSTVNSNIEIRKAAGK